MKKLSLVATTSALAFAGQVKAGAQKSPNILFILTDDQGWSQTSAKMHPDMPESGSNYLYTPNIERIASKGVRFTSGYSSAPLCTPSRRCIQCGTSAVRSGSEFVSTWIPSKHITIAKALKQANPLYATAHFGKWGDEMMSTPEECGYDVSDGETSNGTGGMEGRDKPYFLVDDPKRTGTVTQRAVDFMKEQVQAGRPFYTQVSYYAMHMRIELMEKSLKKYEKKGTPDRKYTAGWAGMLEELDAGIGQLLNAVDELGISDNTYIVFTSDNGGRGMIPDKTQVHGKKETNYPLQGAKQDLWEGGVRVPFMVAGPGIAANSANHTPVCGYDLLPTFYAMAGGAGKLPNYVDGGNLTSLLMNSEATIERSHNALVFHRPNSKYGMSAVRQGDFKLVFKWGKSDANAWKTERGALANDIKSKKLFNVAIDPREKNNLIDQYPEKADEMEKILEDFIKSVENPDIGNVKRRKKSK